MERYESDARYTVELWREVTRLASHPLREIRRLEHEAELGESPATPAILVAGAAIFAWALAAIVVVTAFTMAAVLTR